MQIKTFIPFLYGLIHRVNIRFSALHVQAREPRLGGCQMSEDGVVSRGSIVHEPFKTLDSDMDSTRKRPRM